MEFCSKCKGLCLPGEGKLVCRKCGYIQNDKCNVVLEYDLPKEDEKEVFVFDPQARADKMSTIEAKCPKCGHGKALWWMVQTRASDEPATKFYRCAKCGKTWRDYS